MVKLAASSVTGCDTTTHATGLFKDRHIVVSRKSTRSNKTRQAGADYSNRRHEDNKMTRSDTDASAVAIARTPK